MKMSTCAEMWGSGMWVSSLMDLAGMRKRKLNLHRPIGFVWEKQFTWIKAVLVFCSAWTVRWLKKRVAGGKGRWKQHSINFRKKSINEETAMFLSQCPKLGAMSALAVLHHFIAAAVPSLILYCSLLVNSPLLFPQSLCHLYLYIKSM